MAASNKWIKFCIENAEDVSNYTTRMKTRKVLPTVGNIVDLTIPEECQVFDMTEEENDDLASYLITTYKTLQKIDILSTDRVGQVVLFIVDRVKESERQREAQQDKRKIGKTRAWKRKMDEDNTQRKKRKLESKEETGSIEFTCTYCFAKRDRIQKHVEKCKVGPKDVKERANRSRRSLRA